MAENFYVSLTNDYYGVQGDTIFIPMEFKNEDGDIIDITPWDSKFNVRNPITDENETSLSKTHNDSISGGDGIYYNGDTNIPSGISISTNQIVVKIDYDESSELEPDVYPFDVEFTALGRKFTVKGRLIITSEVTASV